MPRTFALLPAILAACALAGCGSGHESEKEKPASLPVVQVRVLTVENKSRAITEEVAGTVRAKLHATLEAKLSGRIEEMPVALADQVRKGQLIARLEAGEVAARLEQAEASLDQADLDWKRASALFEQQSLTRAEYDAAQARQRLAQGAAAEAKAMMNHAQIIAPFDGVVARKWAEVGDLAAPGKPLVDLEDPSALQMEADVPEALASRLRRGARLAVHVDTVSNEITGLVSEIAPAADPASRTLRVKLELPQTVGLMPGQFARLAVPVGRRSSLRVPAAAVAPRGQLELVFSVTHGRARLHLVKTGARVEDEIEILSGLEAGQTVVISGADQLSDGQPVEAK